MRIILFVLLACSTVSAVVPNISAISVTNIDRSSAQILFTSDTPSVYAQVFWAYNTCPASAPPAAGWNAGVTAIMTDSQNAATTSGTLALYGLEPNTQYCFRVTERPSIDSATDICNVAGCGAADTTFTTLNLPFQAPATPTIWEPTEPDVSAYTLVPLTQQGGFCKASANVTNPGDWPGGSVSSGDSFETILNKVYYGTVLEAQETCTVPDSALHPGVGIPLPVLTPEAVGINNAAHRWIVIRGKTTAGRVPPFGKRIEDEFQSELVAFETASARSSENGAQFFGHLDSVGSRGGAHHFWISTAIFRLSSSASTSGTYKAFLNLGSNFLTSNTNHIVLDRLSIEFPAGTTWNKHSNSGAVQFNGSYMGAVGVTMRGFKAAGGVVLGWVMTPGNPTYGQYHYYKNNRFQSVGAAFIHDDPSAQGQGDAYFYRNLFTQGKKYNPNDPSWNGEAYDFLRNPFEIKQGQRFEFAGNITANWWSNQSPGSAYFFSSRANMAATVNAGITDIYLHHNLVAKGTNGIECQGNESTEGNRPTSLQTRQTARFQASYNLLYDLNAQVTAYGPGGTKTGAPIFNSVGCQDFKATRNTFGPYYSDLGPLSMYFGQGPGITNAAVIEDNIFWLNKDNNGYSGLGGGNYVNTSTYSPILPTVTLSVSGSAPPYANNVSQDFFSFGASGRNPSATWQNNLLICGQVQTSPGGAFGTMNQAACDTLKANWPSGDNTTSATGATMAARQSAVGINAADYYTCDEVSACAGKGVDQLALFQALGRVTDIGTPVPTGNSVSMSYTFNGSNSDACYVQFSTDGGSTWGTLRSDGSGADVRTPIFTGLASNTVHNWRLLCAYLQTANNDYFTDYRSDEITAGSFTTTEPSFGPTLRGGAMGGVLR